MFEHDFKRRLQTAVWSVHAAAVAILLAAVGSVYGLAMRPLDRRLAECRAESAKIEALLAHRDHIASEHAKLRQSLADVEEKAAAIQRRVPDEPMEAEFLGQVAQAAAQAGLQVRDYRPAGSTVKSACSRLEIQLACQGSYAALCRFLDRLAALPRLARVVNLDVTGSSGADCTMTVTLVVFFHINQSPDAKPAGQVPAAVPIAAPAVKPAENAHG
jgi:Tfp pilus assembly protein PilO